MNEVFLPSKDNDIRELPVTNQKSNVIWAGLDPKSKFHVLSKDVIDPTNLRVTPPPPVGAFQLIPPASYSSI